MKISLDSHEYLLCHITCVTDKKNIQSLCDEHGLTLTFLFKFNVFKTF